MAVNGAESPETRKAGIAQPTGESKRAHLGQMLAAEQGGQTTSYRYSGSGQRTFKQVGTQSAKYYVRDGAELLAVVEGSSVRHWNITRPGGPAVGRHEPGGSRRYYVTDLLGSIRAVLDGSGSVDAVRNYYAESFRHCR